MARKLILMLALLSGLVLATACTTAKDSRPFWREDELAIAGHQPSEASRYEMTLQERPPYYRGPTPIRYTGAYLLENIPGRSIPEAEVPPLFYEFPEFVVDFIHNGRGMRVIGAQVRDSRGRLLAEAKEAVDGAEEAKPGSQRIEEVHYNASGGVIFRCISTMKGGIKRDETIIFGSKDAEYFFVWPKF